MSYRVIKEGLGRGGGGVRGEGVRKSRGEMLFNTRVQQFGPKAKRNVSMRSKRRLLYYKELMKREKSRSLCPRC